MNGEEPPSSAGIPPPALASTDGGDGFELDPHAPDAMKAAAAANE
jgi:hypothetical protein